MKPVSSVQLKSVLGFSLIELLSVVAVIGILASAGYVIFTNVNKSVHQEKLLSEVATLNSSVSTYLGFGGKLDDAQSADEVFQRLKSAANSETTRRIPGLSSSMIDPRITTVVKTDAEADKGELRVVWNKAKKKFETATSGSGITAFLLDTDAAENGKVEETREFEYLYAKEDTWVWDYSDNSGSTAPVPTSVTTTPGTILPGTPPPTVPTPTDPESTATPLSPPTYSTPGGSYSIRDYALGVTLQNPNPNGSSNIYYQTNYGPWLKYTTGTLLDVAPDDVINAQAIAATDEYSDSSRVNQSYLATPVQLNAPRIMTSADTFGVFENRLIGVVIQDTNPGDDTIIEYRIGNGPWITYTGFLLLDRVDFSDGAVITSRATSEDPYYLASNNAIDIVGADPVQMLGEAEGLFSNPDGSSNMSTNLSRWNRSDDYFEWGRVTNSYGQTYYGYDKSWMDFDGLQTGDITSGERFQLGTLDYYNGRFVADTGADSVDLDLALTFNLGGNTYNTSFDYEFELINTINDSNNLLGWASADYVRINQSNSATQFEIEGITFELVLEFGDTTSDGFADFNEFHVKEQRGATSALYGTIIDRTTSQGTVGSDGQANGRSISDIASSGGDPKAILDWLNSVKDSKPGPVADSESEPNSGNAYGNGKGKGLVSNLLDLVL